MNLDLTGLAEIVQPVNGEPLMLPLDAISRDPNQPRKHIDEHTLKELAESIRAIGVVQPISVRPDPASPGRHIINYGERRYLATEIAGLSAIPAFVHKAPGSYTQVAENLHRADLSPMEIALFIRRRMDDGEKKFEIAANLGYKKSYVTEHLALLESPACVEKAHANGVASARTLYDLRRLYEEFPRQVDAWIASGVEVTREAIVAFGQKVRHDELAQDPATVSRSSKNGVQEGGQTMLDAQVPALSAAGDSKKGSVAEANESLRSDAVESPPLSQHIDQGRAGVAAEVKRPLRKLRIRVNHGGRSAMIDDDSVVRIRYADGGVDDVRLSEVVVVAAVAA